MTQPAQSFHRGQIKSSAGVGTIFGPNAFDEYLVVKGRTSMGSVVLWTATWDDIRAAMDRGDVRSVAEHNLKTQLSQKP